jgi:cbb3-type cytochrome oxidase cytochrome c subunit
MVKVLPDHIIRSSVMETMKFLEESEFEIWFDIRIQLEHRIGIVLAAESWTTPKLDLRKKHAREKDTKTEKKIQTKRKKLLFFLCAS